MDAVVASSITAVAVTIGIILFLTFRVTQLMDGGGSSGARGSRRVAKAKANSKTSKSKRPAVSATGRVAVARVKGKTGGSKKKGVAKSKVRPKSKKL